MNQIILRLFQRIRKIIRISAAQSVRQTLNRTAQL